MYIHVQGITEARLSDWQEALESRCLKININKTETKVCAKTNETLMIKDRTGHLLKQTETLKYLGSVMNAKGSCDQGVKNRIKAA